MNDNIDLTKILEGCPKGTEFYSPLFGKVKFSYMYGSRIGIECVRMHSLMIFNPTGKYEMIEMRYSDNNGNYLFSDECLLFPSKDQKDWSKFKRFWDKPKKERFNPKTLKPFDKVLGRDYCGGRWKCALFSHIMDDSIFPYVCIGNSFIYCMPYNDDTKHLAGTDEKAPEYYRYWEE